MNKVIAVVSSFAVCVTQRLHHGIAVPPLSLICEGVLMQCAAEVKEWKREQLKRTAAYLAVPDMCYLLS